MASYFPFVQLLLLNWVFEPYLRLSISWAPHFQLLSFPFYQGYLTPQKFPKSGRILNFSTSESLLILPHSHHCLCFLTHSWSTLCLEISSFTLLASLLYRLWLRLIFSQSRHCQYPQFSSPIIHYSLCAVTFSLSPSPQTLYSNRTKSTGSFLNVPCCYGFLFLCLWHSLLEIPVIQRYI